jgi:hypothetical protein
MMRVRGAIVLAAGPAFPDLAGADYQRSQKVADLNVGRLSRLENSVGSQ